MSLSIRQALIKIFDENRITTRSDLEVWCAGQKQHSRLHDEVMIRAPERFKKIGNTTNFKSNTRSTYRNLLEGYGESSAGSANVATSSPPQWAADHFTRHYDKVALEADKAKRVRDTALAVWEESERKVQSLKRALVEAEKDRVKSLSEFGLASSKDYEAEVKKHKAKHLMDKVSQAKTDIVECCNELGQDAILADDDEQKLVYWEHEGQVYYRDEVTNDIYNGRRELIGWVSLQIKC
jgi:hypothetical protein